MTTCPFCRIISGELYASRILENIIGIAFLDIEPVNTGHTLVIPRRHVTSLTELTSAELEGLTQMVQQVAATLKSALSGCEGITVSMADGEAAGQEVPHAHFHVIPRHANDGFGWRRFGCATDRAQLDSTAFTLRSSMHGSNEPAP